MKKLYINCESGVSGDMMLGAFIDMGVPAVHVEKQLGRLRLHEFRLEVNNKTVNDKFATDVNVVLNSPEQLNTNPYSGDYRNYGQILDLINSSTLSKNIKVLSRRIFEIKAKAEAKVHRVPLEEVKFHEAGAIDSIVDIVGAAICCEYTKADVVISQKVPTGYGEVKCACGILPVPVPAVNQILKDTQIPHYRSDIPQEVLTPTGASIIAGISDEFGWEEVKGTILQRGYGTGKRDTGLPPLELILCEEKMDVNC